MPRAALRACRAVATASVAGAFVLSALPAAARDWTITPQISVQQNYTDNVLLTPTNRRPDFITTLAPSLSITGESARLQGTLNYSPTGYLYARTSQLDAVGQNLYANGTATLVPHLFFLDANAYAALLPTAPGLATGAFAAAPSAPGGNFGGIGTSAFAGIPTNQLTQATSFSASPYLAHRFGGFGAGELRYTVTDTNNSLTGRQNTTLTPPGLALQNTHQLVNEGTAAFLTGENFGRFASRVVLDTAQSSGSGVLQSNQNIAVADSAFAINPRVFALGSIGYEHLHFDGFPPIRINDAIWGVGTRLLPRPNAAIIVLYGRRNGVTAPYVSAYYPVTPRTTLTFTYSAGLSTTSQQIAADLAVSALNPAGQTVDVRTLLPAAIANPVLGVQSGLYRLSQALGTATLTLARDKFSLIGYHTTNSLLAQSAPGLGTSQQTTGGSGQWSRQITRLTTANLGVGYTHFNFPSETQFNENLLTVGLSLTYTLTRTVNGWAGYSLLHRTSLQPSLRLMSNVVFVGVSKAF